MDLNLPANYSRIQRVHSFSELVSTRFADGVNALCWERSLPGDFAEVVDRLGTGEGIVTLEAETLRALPVSAAGHMAIEAMLADLELLRAQELAPVLNIIHGYPRDEAAGPVVTDVFSFHADSAPVEADTWLCTYHGVTSEGLRNEEAQRRVEMPATRAELLKLYGGVDDASFCEFLNKHCYDLHYAPVAGAKPFSFGLGNLWRIAALYQFGAVPRVQADEHPSIHDNDADVRHAGEPAGAGAGSARPHAGQWAGAVGGACGDGRVGGVHAHDAVRVQQRPGGSAGAGEHAMRYDAARGWATG